MQADDRNIQWQRRVNEPGQAKAGHGQWRDLLQRYASEVAGIVGPDDSRIERAFGDVDRAEFLDGFYVVRGGRWAWVAADARPLPRHAAELIYSNQALATTLAPDGLPTSSSSMPALMMRMLKHLGVAEGMRVLEIGTGTGYNAALLARLAGEGGLVVTVEINAGLVAKAQPRVTAATAPPGFATVELACGDGGSGWPAGAPYDRIIATAGCGSVPDSWWDQLDGGGLVLMPFAHGASFPLVALRPAVIRGEWTGSYVGHANFMVATGEHLSRSVDATVRRSADQHVQVEELQVRPQQVEDLTFHACLELGDAEPVRLAGGSLGTRLVAGVGLRNDCTGGVTVLVGARLYSSDDEVGLGRFRAAIERWTEHGCPGLSRYRMRVLADGGQPPPLPAGTVHRWLVSRPGARQIVDLLEKADNDERN